MDEKNEHAEFILSRVFEAHKQDTKCVVATPSGGLITGSRDETVKLWAERAGTYEQKIEIKQRNRLAVNSLAFYQSSDNDQWLLFAGLKDGSIEVYNADISSPLLVLTEHGSNVCVLFVDTAQKLLLSGSWDARAIVWSIEDILGGNEFINRREVAHHKNSVWAISTLPTTPVQYLTGSADRTIKLHNSSFAEVYTFEGHKDVVRSIVALSESVFASAANDSTVRVWDTESKKCLQVCESIADEYIYSICKLEIKSGQEYLISGGEKGYCEIWAILGKRNLVHLQQIRIPVESIWSVTASRNTDIALATSSGSVYVFTTDKSRRATEDLLEAFDAEFAALLEKETNMQKSTENEVVTIKVALDDGAPNLELKYTKGTDPAIAAETFIKDNNLPSSYLNEITEYIKSNVPEARLAEAAKYPRQSTQKSVIDGEKFDYSLEVRLQENGPPLQFGYNVGEDPDFATQRFVEKHNLELKFMPQLSTFLRSQIPELQTDSREFVRIGGNSSSASGYVDPFTGSGRYVPGGIPGNTVTPRNVASGDPLTGGTRYVPGSNPADLLPNSSIPRDKKRPRGELIPIRDFFKFGVEGAGSKVIPKLKEMNDLQPFELKLDDAEIEAMNEIMSPPEYEVKDTHITALEKGLQWSLDTIVPVLDVFRVALLNKKLNEAFCSDQGSHGRTSNGIDILQRLSILLISDPPDPVRILICRAMVNAACFETGRKMLIAGISDICKIVANQLHVPKHTVQIPAASAFANFARILLMQTENGNIQLGPREDVLRAIINATETTASFSDCSPVALTRILQAIGSLMWGDSAVITLAKNRNIITIANRIKDSVVEENAKSLARDIIEMVHAV